MQNSDYRQKRKMVKYLLLQKTTVDIFTLRMQISGANLYSQCRWMIIAGLIPHRRKALHIQTGEARFAVLKFTWACSDVTTELASTNHGWDYPRGRYNDFTAFVRMRDRGSVT